jgi:uncharacterized damage-inducible protein DinB
MSIAEGFAMEMEHESGVTREKISRVTDDKLDYKPHDKSMSMRQLIGHLGEAAHWGVSIVTEEVYDIDPETYSVPQPATVAEAVTAYDESIKAFMAALKDKDDAHMMKNWKMTVKGNPVMDMPRVVVVRNFVLNHQVHHRAQLGLYLRMNDIPLPQVYGPSADEGSMG